MIGISRLYCGTSERGDALRYRTGDKSRASGRSDVPKPVVVWNCTKRCNLRCIHCYSKSDAARAEAELSTDEGYALLEDLAAFGCPVVLFSGGEPLLRRDVLDLAKRAVELGLRAVISTNGTLIDERMAGRIREVGVSYVGVSLDGMESANDRFRGLEGAFDQALAGIRNCMKSGVRTGLRFTITRRNVEDLPGIFGLLRDENIPRVCFYHLAYAGRGAGLAAEDLDRDQTRRAVDLIIDRTSELHRRGLRTEVLTVDNHADGPYLYLRMLREQNVRAADVLQLLVQNGGNSSGRGIGCVSWDGSVHPDQFWRQHVLGNVRERSFTAIWTDLSDPLLAGLRDRQSRLKGRCATCRFLNACGGNLRARAEAMTGDMWAPDPACYLTNNEIASEGMDGADGAALSQRGTR